MYVFLSVCPGNVPFQGESDCLVIVCPGNVPFQGQSDCLVIVCPGNGQFQGEVWYLDILGWATCLFGISAKHLHIPANMPNLVKII